MTTMSWDSDRKRQAIDSLATPTRTYDLHPPKFHLARWVIGVGLVVLVVMVIALAHHNSVGAGSSGAIQACEDQVSLELAAPSTAVFSDETALSDGDAWTVTGNVDAGNALGGTLREGWNCTLAWDPTSLTFTTPTVTGIV